MNNLTKTKVGGGKTFKRFLALFLILLGCATTGAWAQETTVEKKAPFGANENTQGTIDTNISYTTAKGDGTTAPAISSGNLRLYQPASGKTYGGQITITAAEGYTLKTVEIGSAQATNVSFTKDDETSHSTKTSIDANGTYKVENVDAQSITFYCMGADKKHRLDINLLKVTYAATGPAKEVTSIAISGTPTTTAYMVGDTPSADGLTVTANYSDATSKDVTAQVAWTFTPETLAEGTTTVTATATYNGLTATTNFTATAKAVTQLIFDKTKGAFDKLSSYNKDNNTMNAVTLVDINGASLNGFTTNGGKTAASNGCLQLAKTSGKLVSPAFPDFTNGYTVKITYYIGGSNNPTLTSGELTATGKADGTGTMADGTGFSVELTVPTGAAFELTAGNATYISRIEITKNDAPEPTTATITLNAACTDGEMVYGTFSSSKAFKVSNDIIVSEITVENDKLIVTNYASGAIVPANTGVMVSAMEGGDYTVELSDEEGTSVLGTNNMLKPGSEAMSGDCKFYRLTMHGGKTLGFFWGAAEGAAFSIAADKAYLAVPTTMAANIQGFTFSDTETGINGINAAEGKQAIYNLQGQRVSRAVKGIYIVNGKKVIIK